MALPNAKTQIVQKVEVKEFQTCDKTNVKVFPGFSEEGLNTYYYLPANLRLAIKKDKTPEFSFLTYKSADGNEIDGAILHLLFEWGLTADQEKEIDKKIKSTLDSNAVLAGVISLEIPEKIPSFLISGDSELAKILGSRWSQPPVASVIPGTRMAISYRLTAAEAKLFEAALIQPSKFDGISVELKFIYRGGYRQNWYNLIKGDTYTLKSELKDILRPVIQEQKK
ncbi:MAG: hypothetical protein ABJB16_03275 [Saprospiraceae bacterium]